MALYSPGPASDAHRALADRFAKVVLTADFTTEEDDHLKAGLTGCVVELLDGPPGVAFLVEVFEPEPGVVCVPADLVAPLDSNSHVSL